MLYPVFRIAWRNLWRNTRRTIITTLAVGFGVAVMVFASGYATGMKKHLIESITRSGSGVGQISHEGYIATGDSGLFIPDATPILEKLARDPLIKGASPRVKGEGLLAMGDRSAHVTLIGVEPEKEGMVTGWTSQLTGGVFLGEPKTVVIGKELMKTLEVETGSKLVLTVADVLTGELKYRLLTVSGVVSTGSPALDRHAGFINRGELAEDLGIGRGIHEIALAVKVDAEDREALRAALKPYISPGVEALEWQVLSPVVARMSEVMVFYNAIILGVIFFLIAFGIVNTMSMSLIERFREFGILRALGTPPFDLAKLILAEAWWMGLAGSACGLALGLAANAFFAWHGISFEGVEALGVSFSTPLYPVFHWPEIFFDTLAFLVLTPLAAVTVAVRASMVDPVRALRSE